MRGRTRWLRVPYRNARQIFRAAYALIADNLVAQRLLAECGERIQPDLACTAMRDGPRPQVHRFSSWAAEQDAAVPAVRGPLAQAAGTDPAVRGVDRALNHELTTQIPHVVDIALHGRAARPRLDYPPVRVFWFSGPAWSEGVENYKIDDVAVRIYGPEKSVADSFKYRRKIGLDVALEALKLYRQHPGFDVNLLLHYARICRVENVMRPYLEALL